MFKRGESQWIETVRNAIQSFCIMKSTMVIAVYCAIHGQVKDVMSLMDALIVKRDQRYHSQLTTIIQYWLIL